ncbi:uncharacterized protein ARMOST_12371 [Armillaria ostoyae]|uniref:Uncharacterized protein n=1 Tax=Armillaria ostoyae TaxID=47428 RepID=A0A284RJS0_ARMOS|nr:uncharacterized protein ARMOST_12371 [Armillaria ostoyae]
MGVGRKTLLVVYGDHADCYSTAVAYSASSLPQVSAWEDVNINALAIICCGLVHGGRWRSIIEEYIEKVIHSLSTVHTSHHHINHPQALYSTA